MKTVLILGSGGREHAMARKCCETARVIVAPGNDGMEFERWEGDLAKGTSEFQRLAEKARSEKIDLMMVGPDQALADGAVDVFQKAGVPAFGPSQSASRIESSKAFSKEIMRAAGVSTAKFEVIQKLSDIDTAFKKYPDIEAWVVKADGLALGKGVRVCSTRDEARAAAEDLFREFKKELVLEERLQGEELSWLAICGENASVRLFEPARDYKRLTEDAKSPNTGGMGAYSPVEPYDATWARRIESEVFVPVLKEMEKRGNPFRGVLYAGLMIHGDRYWVLEFNARMGDPETQALLPRLKSDFVEYAFASATGNLSKLSPMEFKNLKSVFVVGAAPGYPNTPLKGAKLRTQPGAKDIYFAGVKTKEGSLTASGGRVYGALGLDTSLEGARKYAYSLLEQTGFERMQFRKDIGT